MPRSRHHDDVDDIDLDHQARRPSSTSATPSWSTCTSVNNGRRHLVPLNAHWHLSGVQTGDHRQRVLDCCTAQTVRLTSAAVDQARGGFGTGTEVEEGVVDEKVVAVELDHLLNVGASPNPCQAIKNIRTCLLCT
jgi:hypothetical protein